MGKRYRGAIICLLGGLLGCSGSDSTPSNDAAGERDTAAATLLQLPGEIDRTKPLRELNEDERRAICVAVVEVIDKVAGPTLSSRFGIGVALEQAGAVSCEEARDFFREQLADPSARCAEAPPTECDVTVGEAEACLNDTARLIARILPPLSCVTDTAEFAQIQQDMDEQLAAFDQKQPASCVDMNSECQRFTIRLGDLAPPKTDAGLANDAASAGDGVTPDAGPN